MRPLDVAEDDELEWGDLLPPKEVPQTNVLTPADDHSRECVVPGCWRPRYCPHCWGNRYSGTVYSSVDECKHGEMYCKRCRETLAYGQASAAQHAQELEEDDETDEVTE